MANADTPGYAARDVQPFQALVDADTFNFDLRATRDSHLNAPASDLQLETRERPDAMADPNGNSVSLEAEMVKAVEAQGQHAMAQTVYRKVHDLMRMGLGRIR